MSLLHRIGGNGGSGFNLDGTRTGGTLKKMWVWVGGWQIKGIRVWLTDGQSIECGQRRGNYSEFVFQSGEYFSDLSLWGNGAGTRLGAIKFKTNKSRTFFVKMTDWGLKTEYPISIGSGICVGMEKLNVSIEEIKSMTYHNDSTVNQEYKTDTEKTIIETSSWTVTNSMENTFSIDVKAGIPGIVEVGTGYSIKEGSETSRSLQSSVSRTEKLSFPVRVPAGKSVEVDITIGRATFNLPYTGVVRITCYDGTVMHFQTSGTYRGVTYTELKLSIVYTCNASKKQSNF
uniref:Jacalin-type lectin domain-containing protein n=1 Tax=Astyanax mexicanus TaxID=7994 RepID=A0A8B9LC66_ASTMX